MSIASCQLACDVDPECGAFGIEAHTIKGVTRSECCLFLPGNTGEGSSEHLCYIKGAIAQTPSPTQSPTQSPMFPGYTFLPGYWFGKNYRTSQGVLGAEGSPEKCRDRCTAQ